LCAHVVAFGTKDSGLDAVAIIGVRLGVWPDDTGATVDDIADDPREDIGNPERMPLRSRDRNH